VRQGIDQFLELSTVHEFLKHGLEQLRLTCSRAEFAVLVDDHTYRKQGYQGEANHDRAAEHTNIS
jgi:hypothetical protein